MRYPDLITDLSTSPFLSTNCLPEMPPIVDHPRNETLIIRDIIDGVAVLQWMAFKRSGVRFPSAPPIKSRS